MPRAIVTAAILSFFAALSTLPAREKEDAPRHVASAQDPAQQLADLQAEIETTDAARQRAMAAVQQAEKRLTIVRDSLRLACGSMSDYEDALATLERARENVKALTAKLDRLKSQYARLKAARSKA